jgi:ATP-dependent exoDNAse (exonuclease V) alpha subunit
MEEVTEVITYHVEIISRGRGRSAVQLAAYCARERLHCDYDGQTYDYTKKIDLAHSEIILPDFAPRSFYNRETLWNAVELIEKSKNARLARAVILTLPKELKRDTHIGMVRRYVQEYFVNQGMCADIAIHDKRDDKPHAHMTLTTRSLDENGEWMSKQRKQYLLNPDGSKIFDPERGCYKIGQSIKTNDWDSREYIEKWRKGWADVWNFELERFGVARRVTNESYARQGLKREPTKHLGRAVMALEDRGILTSRGNENRAIEARNKTREEREHQHKKELERDRERKFVRSR